MRHPLQTCRGAMSFSIRFTHAITRRPAASITRGLRAVDTGNPDLALMQAHHDAYVATLRDTGATVIELPALDAYPDSVFVEDTALCLPQGAVAVSYTHLTLPTSDLV